jgi:hypothetical protein
MDISFIPSEQLLRIGTYVVILLLIWGALRFVLKVTQRVFQFGCLMIILLGAGLVFLQFIGGG